MPALAGVRNLYLDDPRGGRSDSHCNFGDRSGRACKRLPVKTIQSIAFCTLFLLANDTTSASFRRNARGMGIKQDDSDAAQRTARETVGGAAGSIRQLVRHAVRPLRRVRWSPRPLPLITGDTVAIETRAAIRDIGYLWATDTARKTAPRLTAVLTNHPVVSGASAERSGQGARRAEFLETLT
jgi:hypothetical protein